ncbi:LOW QUALITY PROTEIN: synaptic vesicle 2-related protein [Manduca sexta]|uniref:LOW QUALITY PROTEIN: synaptic vesicle 2-related protein n=1 Tax=Manduca sexta TaxID=7130 RepID=UPI00188E4D4C|nr:LOW QUALITY PROTEIN: synaptic vesicle 2-related protein [Manduca sexta]
MANKGDGDRRKKDSVWTISHGNREEYACPYGDAINLAGNGWYSATLLATLSSTTFAMVLEMFGLSVVVSGATCDFDLGLAETSILLSMPFVGPIVMAFPWGYISDTYGRRRSLRIALWVSFAVSAISSFSPHWILLAVLKFISTSFCSCAQSAAYTMLGECTTENSRDAYILVMTSVLDFSLTLYVTFAYFIVNLDFVYHLGFITFTPWRLLNLVLSIPLGLGALGTYFYYESPKFLVNVGRSDEALDILKNIWRRNGGRGKYPVSKVYLKEEGNLKSQDLSFLRSLWDQIIPLFKPPLLYRSLQLYFLTAVVFSINNSYYIWFPFLAEKFASGFSSTDGNSTVEQVNGLCSIIVSEHQAAVSGATCSSTVDLSLVWSSLAQGASFVVILLLITKIAYRKKLLMIIILSISGFSTLGAVVINDSITSFIMYFGLLFNELCTGFIFSYFVDLYPTSYRGTAACVGVMVARAGALGGVNILGAFLMSHCTATFYGTFALMLSTVAVSFLLPPDKSLNKTVST